MRLLLALAFAVLALAPAASAKELKSATICGTNGCKTVTDPERLRELPLGGQTTAPAPSPAAFYTVGFRIAMGRAEDHRLRMLYVPSKTIVAWEVYGDVTWAPVYGEAIDAMATATSGLEPFRAPIAWPTDIRRVTPGPAPAGFDWPLVYGSLLAAFALGLGTLLLVRRSPKIA
jgi:hypothetical protein